MASEYPIVSVAHDSRREKEPMGSKEKFWFQRSDGADWLFKFPTKGTGGHWAEKIAFEVARNLRIPAAHVELALYRDGAGNEHRGSICRSFSSGYELYHGNQILAGLDSEYDLDKRYKQSQHTASRMFSSMAIFSDNRSADRYRGFLANYLVLDALIGNVDRHHENWGVLRKRANGGWKGRLAPTFDHASSLGRELRDAGAKKSRKRHLQELGVGHYTEHARGAVYVAEADARAPSPVDLVRRCLDHPSLSPFFAAACGKVMKVLPETIAEDVVAGVPPAWMTPISRSFVVSLLRYNYERMEQMTA